jgi:hypothetical protein
LNTEKAVEGAGGSWIQEFRVEMACGGSQSRESSCCLGCHLRPRRWRKLFLALPEPTCISISISISYLYYINIYLCLCIWIIQLQPAYTHPFSSHMRPVPRQPYAQPRLGNVVVLFDLSALPLLLKRQEYGGNLRIRWQLAYTIGGCGCCPLIWSEDFGEAPVEMIPKAWYFIISSPTIVMDVSWKFSGP